MLAGRSAVRRIQAFDPSSFKCQIAAEIEEFKVSKFVPKWYRKATKVMARDIALAVAAADQAARDAGLTTKGTSNDGQAVSHDPTRVGCHIGAGLIAAELDELTSALATSRDGDGRFNIRNWGREGMNNLYPLWLLKYLPNMLACHVTIIHDTHGPSNTITCGDTSAMLSIGESLRVIQRGAADACFCGGAESKVNPMAFLRQYFANRLTPQGNDEPPGAVRPFCRTASGTALGEGGAIVILEERVSFERRAAGRDGGQAYARVIGFGASQSVNRATRNLLPEKDGRGIAQAIKAALREADVDPGEIDLVVPFGLALPACDEAEAEAFRKIFGNRLAKIPLVPIKTYVGNCCAGAAALDVCIAAAALHHQTIPAVINCCEPLEGINAATAPSRPANLKHALVVSTGMGGQNAALVLKRFED